MKTDNVQLGFRQSESLSLSEILEPTVTDSETHSGTGHYF